MNLEINNLFKNSAQKGSFGEFVYQIQAQRYNLNLKPTRILEYDFLFIDVSGKSNKIDVKATTRDVSGYGGKRIRAEIIYDLIKITPQDVLLIPDDSSPLRIFGSTQKIGLLSELYELWLEAKGKKTQAQNGVRNFAAPLREQLKLKISDYFSPLKVRIIFRGHVSETRWSSLPDNLPGTTRTLSKYDITIFIQMKTNEDSEFVSRAFILVHSAIGRIPLRESDSRQKRKGVMNVLDIEQYAKEFPHLIFTEIDQLFKARSVLFASQ